VALTFLEKFCNPAVDGLKN